MIGKIMEINKKHLKTLYETLDRKEICKVLGCCQSTLTKILIEAGVKLKGKGNRKPKKKVRLF